MHHGVQPHGDAHTEVPHHSRGRDGQHLHSEPPLQNLQGHPGSADSRHHSIQILSSSFGDLGIFLNPKTAGQKDDEPRGSYGIIVGKDLATTQHSPHRRSSNQQHAQ